MLGMASEESLPGLRKLTDMFHRYNTPVFAQINHAGSATKPELTGEEVVSADDLGLPQETKVVNSAPPRALRPEELPEIVRAFADAAARAKNAGYDGVVIHAAHAYLLNQFLDMGTVLLLSTVQEMIPQIRHRKAYLSAPDTFQNAGIQKPSSVLLGKLSADVHGFNDIGHGGGFSRFCRCF